MGLFDGMMGNASEINTVEIQKEFAKILAPNKQLKKDIN
jgi:hypothetical protein